MWIIFLLYFGGIAQTSQAAGYYTEPCSGYNEKISESLTRLTDCMDQTLTETAGKLPALYCESEKKAYLGSLSEAEKCKIANKILPSKTK